MLKELSFLKSRLKKVQKLALSIVETSISILLFLGFFLFRLTLAFIVVLSFAYLAARSPEIHSYLIREKVGSRTYTIRGGFTTGGGTGFAVKAKSGLTYIVSNAHVCELSVDGYHVFVSNDEGRYMWRRILEISNYSDLCLIESMPGVEGLSLGSEPVIGQIVAAVGHPSLMPITLSRGEIISAEDIEIIKGIVVNPNDPTDNQLRSWMSDDFFLTPEKCSMPKNKIVTIKFPDIFSGKIYNIKLCLEITKKAYRTNILIQPGNSGSPVVNFWGNIVGVVFASDKYNWGIVVSFKDLSRLLSNY